MARRPRALANDPNYEPDLPPERGFLYDPQTPLLTIGSRRAFTLDMAYEGVHIFGGTGSGKSSGSMATLARAYLSAGMGGSIPLTTTLAGINPTADIVLLGVPDAESRIHSTNESVHPEEIRRIALGEALFLRRLAAGE